MLHKINSSEKHFIENQSRLVVRTCPLLLLHEMSRPLYEYDLQDQFLSLIGCNLKNTIYLFSLLESAKVNTSLVWEIRASCHCNIVILFPWMHFWVLSTWSVAVRQQVIPLIEAKNLVKEGKPVLVAASALQLKDHADHASAGYPVFLGLSNSTNAPVFAVNLQNTSRYSTCGSFSPPFLFWVKRDMLMEPSPL